jgi:hypothetical protein
MILQVRKCDLFKVSGVAAFSPPKGEVLLEKLRFRLVVDEFSCQIFFLEIEKPFYALKQIFPVDIKGVEFHAG